ncbi:MAG: 30S ribosomal protein S1 [Proteobacteria bacterium]|nr:30S ribosomal protein S1 [Pseudomonadota bacterium]
MNIATPESADESYASDEDFAALFAESIEKSDMTVGSVVTGTVIAIENDMALVDVGLKAEGRVSIKEFAGDGEDSEIKVGDRVEVFLDRLENSQGEAVLSREKARREEAWIQLESAFNNGERVEGTIFGRVKGGFTVDLSGAVAFLPGSQVDIRPVRDITPLMGDPHEFVILKMDRHRGNIVVSRRSVLEESRAEQRDELIANLKEGQILEGVVKNITDYGAFVDLGGVDGLLHVTDIAWRRVNHPTEVLSIAQTINVQVIRFNRETQRISLGMKQLEADPWEGVEAKYPVDTKFTGRVTNITDYGAFVELEPGVEGLVHISEMSWTKKNIHPGKIISTSQEVEVKVLDVDPVKRRISLGLKQCRDNPWESFVVQFPVGSLVEGEIKNITEFGIFIGLAGDIDGMAHMSDISWDRPGDEAIKDFNKGDMLKAKVIDVDVAKERISLGIKQLTEDPFAGALASVKSGDQVTCAVTAIVDGGIEVTVDGAQGFIRKAELARDRGDQRPERFAVGEKVDARVTAIDQASRRLTLSIKALEFQEEKQAMSEYGSSNSGASLGDILGAAIDKAEEKRASEAVQKPRQDAVTEKADAPLEEEEAAKPKAKTKKAAAKKAPAEKKAAAPKKAAATKKTAATKKPAATKKAAAAKPESEDD